MSRDRVQVWWPGARRAHGTISRNAAHVMHSRGRGIYSTDKSAITEVPEPEKFSLAGRAGEVMIAGDRGAIRGASCGYNGTIPGRGIGRPSEAKPEQLERDYDPMQRLALTPAHLGALASHMAEETACGAAR